MGQMKVHIEMDDTELDILLAYIGRMKVSDMRSDRDAELFYSGYQVMKQTQREMRWEPE